MLMWSFNRAGECDESLKRDRDTAMGIDAAAKRARRQRALLGSARPQYGVDEMRDDFTGTTPVPGVVDVRAGRGGSPEGPPAGAHRDSPS